ncbi:MAG: cytochrome c biogenesis protein ResB [Microbacteriaceae bacterium]|nr:cytochrome c biogenesis protein ResB [Microbacteriaceae bacterium]
MSRPHDYDDGSGMPTPEKPDKAGTGLLGWLRWFWRQLTSMRVALLLLLLLAVAAIPGSLVPQRAADPNGVVKFSKEHPDIFRILDAFPIQAFDVYSSVWFSAIYLLLFVSLIGCIVPRLRHHIVALRAKPPRTPSRLQRMVGFTQFSVSNPQASEAEKRDFAEKAITLAQKILRRKRYRAAVATAKNAGATEISVSAERGYLRETGNLLFHTGLVGVLLAVAIGGGARFNGQKALVEGETMVNSLIDYDTTTVGRAFNPGSLDAFRMRLDRLEVDYVTGEKGAGAGAGTVTDYRAQVTLFEANGQEKQRTVRVNQPLREHGTPVYIVSNGYAPRIVVRNAAGEIVHRESTLFIPSDGNMTSLGVIKVPFGVTQNGKATQLGMRGFFYPTAQQNGAGAFTSVFPDLRDPLLTLDIFTGDLGINSGLPQSVYELDTSAMKQLTRGPGKPDSLQLRLGQTVDLPDGLGSVTFETAPRYAAFEVMADPAAFWVLVSAVAAFGGLLLSLFIPRRRMWVKARLEGDEIVLQYAGLARGDDPTLNAAVTRLMETHRDQLASL